MGDPTCLPASTRQPKGKAAFDSNSQPENVFSDPYWQLGTEIGAELIFYFSTTAKSAG